MAQAPIMVDPALAAPEPIEVVSADAGSIGITRALPETQRRARLQLAAIAAVLDATLIWVAFCCAYTLRYVVQWVPVERGLVWVSFRDWIPFGILFSLIEAVSLIVAGAYRTTLGRDLPDELLHLCRTSLVGVGVISIVTAYLPIKVESRLVIVYAWFLLVAMLILGRVLLYTLLARLHGSGWNTRRVVVAGTTPVAKMVMQNMLTKRNHGYHLIGFLRESLPALDDADLQDASYARANFGRFACLGDVSQIRDVVSDMAIDEVIVTLPATNHDDIAAICAHCEQADVAVKLVPDLFELSLSRVRMDHIAGIPLIDVERRRHSRLARGIKRAIDVVLSGLALLVVSPVLLLIALAIKLDSRGPVLYKEQRVGKGGKPFTFLKFRSMYVNASEKLDTLIADKGIVDRRIFKDKNDPRRTRVGRFIRGLSLDELPQLINVLRGDMSLVGPRPPLPSEVANYAQHHFKRLEVLGGITGYWQVSGRSNIESFEEIIIMDTYYIDNWSLALDIKIMLRTILAVITRNGAY
jgi:exopolysaccharide biosynthesis polyprenyl glycosylphosphotransferase